MKDGGAAGVVVSLSLDNSLETCSLLQARERENETDPFHSTDGISHSATEICTQLQQDSRADPTRPTLVTHNALHPLTP